MIEKMSTESKEQIAKRMELIMLSGLILIAISQGIGGVCYCLGKYSVNRTEKKVLFELSVSSDNLYDNRVNSILMGKR